MDSCVVSDRKVGPLWQSYQHRRFRCRSISTVHRPSEPHHGRCRPPPPSLLSPTPCSAAAFPFIIVAAFSLSRQFPRKPLYLFPPRPCHCRRLRPARATFRKRNEILELTCDGLAFKGNGVCKVDGSNFIPLCDGALPGECLLARVSRIIDAVDAPCPLAADCGGCRTQSLAHAAQIRHNYLQARELLVNFGKFDPKELESSEPDSILKPIVPCDEIFRFRNKMEFSSGTKRWMQREWKEEKDEEVVKEEKIEGGGYSLGLHAPGFFHKVLHVQKCLLQSQPADKDLAVVQETWMDPALGLTPYDVRKSTTGTPEIMVNFVTSCYKPELLGPLVNKITKIPQVVSIMNNVNTSVGNTSVGEEEYTLHGKPTITEMLKGLTFQISANSFFQTNTIQLAHLMQKGVLIKNKQKMAGGTPRAGDPFDSLPAAVVADVLGRVADVGDIAACRLASRALHAASYTCSRVRLCAAALARRHGGAGAPGPAFRAAAGNLASLLGPHLRSLEIDASEGRGYPDDAMWVEEGEFDEADDLHLTAREAVTAWADTAAGHALEEVDIADYWPQSCWRKAEALPAISRFCKVSLCRVPVFVSCYWPHKLCHNLMKLLLKNAWLSVDGLRIMPNLTHLTLEFIRLDDEDLSKLNECFPCLQILNLIGVGGLKDPNIDLHQLKTCHWEVSNVPRSLTIHAPNLVYLELKCVRPDILILDTPSMSTLKLTVDKLGPNVQIGGLVSLTNLRIESLDLKSLFQVFTENCDISSLELEIPISTNSYELFEAVKPEYLLQLFASINEVKLAPRFSCEMMHFLDLCNNSQFRSCLRKLLVHLPPLNTVPVLVPLFKNCALLCEVTILFHADSSDDIRQAVTSIWTRRYPEIRWHWGTWN
ncbi:hypothetical protein ABZP36_026382 [Zizania latifolia]